MKTRILTVAILALGISACYAQDKPAQPAPPAPPSPEVVSAQKDVQLAELKQKVIELQIQLVTMQRQMLAYASDQADQEKARADAELKAKQDAAAKSPPITKH